MKTSLYLKKIILLSLLFATIGMTACSDIKDDIKELQSDIEILKDASKQLQKAADEFKTIKNVETLTDAEGWDVIFTDGTFIRLENTYSGIVSIKQDAVTKVMTITMKDGTELTFNMEEIHPTGIVALGQKISLFPNSIKTFEFRVNPSNAQFDFDVESEGIAIQLDVIKSTRSTADSYVTPSEHYKLSKIEPSLNEKGEIKTGQYTAYIEDLGTLASYHDKVALVLTTKDRTGNRVQYSSELFHITTGELPIVYLTTPGAQKIVSKDNWLKDCKIRIMTPDGDEDLNASNVSLRGRGNSTWTYPKKPYAIKLNNKEEVLGMPKHKRWVLLANWMDRTLLRNSVAFEIARKTSLSWTPRGTFVEVVLNGTHLGNYYLCEQIKVDKNRVNIAELKETDTEDPAITGGYLVELDTYFDEINKFKTTYRQLPVNIKEPEEDVYNKEQKTYLENYFNKIESILYGENPPVDESYADYINVTSFIDWWLVHELTTNGEANHPKSSYMHKDRGGKLTAGPVWDFDWGTFRPNVNGFAIKNSIWYNSLFQDPEFIAAVKTRWNTLKPDFEAISRFIDEQAAYIRESAETDNNMWPITQNVNGDEKMNYDDAVIRLRKAYKERINLLDKNIGNL